jgi:pyruvate, water dikinase
MNQLKKQHIACLINTHHATQTLRNGQRIIVDANAGKVLQAPAPLTQGSLKPLPGAPTATKLYVAAGNPDKATEYITDEIDGVGVLRSEYAYARFGEHPLAAIRSNHRRRLKMALHDTIQRYHSVRNGLPVIFRSLNMTSQELRALDHAEAFEPQELNPYLGFRGSLKMLSNLELLNFEIETIKEYLEKHHLPLGYMPSFVRTPNELQLLHSHLKDYRLHQLPNYQFWLQLNTPENLLAIDHYLMVPIDGFSVNIRSIHALLHGIDPDEPDIYSLYALDPQLFEPLLRRLVEAVKKAPHPMRGTRAHPEIVMHLEDNSTAFVELAVKLGFTGITVKPAFISIAKHRIREAEAAQIGQ